MNLNKMQEIKLEKVVLHCTTADQQKLERCMKLLKYISGKNPIRILAKKRIPAFKLRPKLPIGYKVTLRKEDAAKILQIALSGITELKESCFGEGYLNFGIREYIEIPTLTFQREIGILGFDISAHLKRTGLRVREKKRMKSKIGNKQKINKEETIEFFKKNFNTKLK
jgi:ribosomal protein L5